ncbi:MAG: hypothetical protein EPN38_07710 [Rhodanobacteraceae bacterium]|nr:MAG: hypothetical protein EPN38_07710 [Rhodanobacteraceae bacterium]
MMHPITKRDAASKHRGRMTGTSNLIERRAAPRLTEPNRPHDALQPNFTCTRLQSSALLQPHRLNSILAKADRGGMCYGVEVRAPFLDQQVIEFAATLPVAERVRGFTTKVFLKRYATGYLPKPIVNRRKRGLGVPLGAWLRGPLLDWARSRLSAPVLRDVGIDSEVALQLLSEHGSHVRDHAKAIWTLVVLSEWLEWRTRL